MRIFVLNPKQPSDRIEGLVFLSTQSQSWISTDGDLVLQKRKISEREQLHHWMVSIRKSNEEHIIGRTRNVSEWLEETVEPPTGLWLLSNRYGRSLAQIEYEGSYLETSSDLLSKEYLEQEQLRDWDSLIDRLISILQPTTEDGRLNGKVVIDVGCGAGAISKRFLSRETSTVIGVDRDPIMVAVSKTLCSATKSSTVGQCKFYLSDVSQVPPSLIHPRQDNDETNDDDGEEEGLADIIWSSFVIAYLPDPIAFMQQWSTAKLLKPHGLLCIIEVDGLFGIHNPLPEEMKHTALQLDQALEPHYFAHYGSQVSTFCHAAGLEVILDEPFVDAEVAFHGATTSSKVLDGWNSRLSRPGISAKLAQCTRSPQQFRDSFLSCLSHPEHTVSSFPRIVIARRRRKQD